MSENEVKKTHIYRAFSHDVTAAILVFQNNKTAVLLVFQTNPLGVELFSYIKTFFCSNELAYTVSSLLGNCSLNAIKCV